MARDDDSDAALLAAARRDPAAFGPLYERHAPAVLAYLRARTRSTEPRNRRSPAPWCGRCGATCRNAS